jgi:hypothetical protein
MNTRSLLASCLGLALLGAGCTTINMRPPGVDGSDYRDWRVEEFRRGHLRPADFEQQLRLQYFSANRGGGYCSNASSTIRGSFCHAYPLHATSEDVMGNNGRRRVVEDPTGHFIHGQERAY